MNLSETCFLELQPGALAESESCLLFGDTRSRSAVVHNSAEVDRWGKGSILRSTDIQTQRQRLPVFSQPANCKGQESKLVLR